MHRDHVMVDQISIGLCPSSSMVMVLHWPLWFLIESVCDLVEKETRLRIYRKLDRFFLAPAIWVCGLNNLPVRKSFGFEDGSLPNQIKCHVLKPHQELRLGIGHTSFLATSRIASWYCGLSCE
jgi:hypothetical protein